MAGEDHEMGQIASAMTVFRDNARRAEDLCVERAAREHAERIAEQYRAQMSKETEARNREELEAARQATMATLEASVGAAVAVATAGNFSGRIEVEFDDPTMQPLSKSVNTLFASIENGLIWTAYVIRQLADGDLCAEMSGDYEGVFAELQDDMNQTVRNMTEMVLRIVADCDDVEAAARDMVLDSKEMAAGADIQAGKIKSTSDQMAKFSETARQNASGAVQASGSADTATSSVQIAGTSIREAVSAMDDIKAASDKIGAIVTMIEELAFQTNMLAVNASVEAARAGDAGRGFAVVATEVSALAQRSSAASSEIRNLIEHSEQRVRRGVGLVESTGTTLLKTIDTVVLMRDALQCLSQASQTQADRVGEFSHALEELDDLTRHNAHHAQEGQNKSKHVAQKVTAVRDLLSAFKTEDAVEASDAYDLEDANQVEDHAFGQTA